ncbi:MAG: hypothetical protein KFB97_06400 [Cyanobium sp. M30B3]|nr:MAG: hypothetical protein KFB97_06400 [Cyanobium sp. M30B3]
MNEQALYAPEGTIITDLRSFSVELDGKTRSLLVWTEVPIEGLQQALNQPDQLAQSPLAVIKTGLINPDADAIAGGYVWNLLFNDASGNSTITEVPWSAAGDSGLTISDLSAANLTVEINGESQLTPVLSWSQAVRTPYNEAVLESNPVLFVPFAAWQPGYNTLNLGAAGGSNTETFASSTGLSSAVQGPLPKSAATAVLNEEGLGVLATGLGSFNTSLLQIARNAPQSSVEPVVALFEGSITDHTLTVTSLRQGTLKVGDLLVGDGVTANSRIKEVVTAATSSSPGTYRLDLSSTVATPTSLRTLPSSTNVPMSTFSGSFSGSGGEAGFTTLTLTGLVGSIQIGDRVLGLGIAGGVTVQEVTQLDLDAGTATLVVDQGPASSNGTYGLASIPGGTSSPYTIEFWTQLAKDSNPAGAGLVGLGQASSAALPDRPVELPDGWLLSSGFAVERLTWQDALNQSLVSALPSDQSASNLYGWRWGLVATGTNTTAMDGTGGSNISRNALVLANLAVGDTIDGVNTFLANYGLSASDLAGIDGTPVDQIASTPSTEFNFATDLVFNTAAQAEVATTSLNAVSVLTDSALMNAGFLSAAEAQANSNLSTMLETLWTFQQETGEVKVNFDLKPTDPNTNQTPAKPAVSQQENYAGFALEFALLPGPAVSVNGNGQIAYDVADGITLLSDASVDYRDGEWHYVAVSFLPDYTSVVVTDTLFEVPSNVGTANLYINGELVATQSNVIDPFAPTNLNDNAQLLAENAGGAIDLLAFYDQALTTLQTPAAAEGWAMPTSTDALELMQEAGYVFEGRTPHPGEQPGAISNHYLAHTVDPNDALEATFTTVLLPQDGGGYSWSTATTLSPQLDIRPTAASASNQNLADALLIPISAGDWQTAGWFVGSSSNAVPFNPANRELESITVALTPLGSANAEVITRTLTPSEVLLGSTSAGNLASLETVQPFSTNSTASLQYRFLSSQPALNLQISEAADSTGDSGTLKPEVNYTAQVTFTFTDSTVVSNVSGNGSQGLALGFSPNVDSNLAFSPNFGSTLKSTVLYGSTALATAQVIEQAPLQLKYIDSGLQFASQVSPANPSPASTLAPARCMEALLIQSTAG